MINEVPIHDYCRVNNDINNVNNLDIKNNNFTIFLQMYEQVNNSRDIISFRDDNKRIFVMNNHILSSEITDFVDIPVKTIIEYTLESEGYTIQDVKYVFIGV